MWLFSAPPFSHFRQHFSYPQQLVVKDFFCHVQQLKQSPVGDRIKHAGSGFPTYHDVPEAQDGQLLGNVRRFEVEHLAQFAYALLAPSKAIHNSNTDRVRERLEEIRLEVSDLLRHMNIQLFEYARLSKDCCQ